MERINCTDKARNEEVLRRVGQERTPKYNQKANLVGSYTSQRLSAKKSDGGENRGKERN